MDGRLRFLVGKGRNAVELATEQNVADGEWHSVVINYSPFQVEVCWFALNRKTTKIILLPLYPS